MNDDLFSEEHCDLLDQVTDEFNLFDELPFDPDEEPSDEALELIEAESQR